MNKSIPIYNRTFETYLKSSPGTCEFLISDKSPYTSINSPPIILSYSLCGLIKIKSVAQSFEWYLG